MAGDVGLERLELELRRVPEVVAVGVDRHDDPPRVQVVLVEPDPDAVATVRRIVAVAETAVDLELVDDQLRPVPGAAG